MKASNSCFCAWISSRVSMAVAALGLAQQQQRADALALAVVQRHDDGAAQLQPGLRQAELLQVRLVQRAAQRPVGVQRLLHQLHAGAGL